MAWQQLLNSTHTIEFNSDVRLWYQTLWHKLENPQPFTLALLGGAQAPTPGLAFLAGYQAALRALRPAAPAGIGALCVTEKRSLKPREFSSFYVNGELTGAKDYVLAGEQADWLWVVARESMYSLPLKVIEVASQHVRFEPISALKLMPEVGHSRVCFERCQGQVLPGDGWDDYAKPFRTLEDIYVLTAMLAWHTRAMAKGSEMGELNLKVLALLSALAHIATLEPKQATTHLLLAGVQAQYRALAADLTAALQGSESYSLWLRDSAVLNLAQAAREARLQKAKAQLTLSEPI